jgi:hypothetical protein
MSHMADHPLDHAPPGPANGLFLPLVFGTVSLLLWLVVAFQLVFIAPHCEKTFTDFKMKLPLVTEWVLHHAWLGAPLALIFWTAISLLLMLSKRTRWLGLMLLIAIPLLFNLAILAGLGIPYWELLDALGGGPQKN